METLSKEELLAKYKNLIIISKKAKQAKDDAVAEIEKEKLDKAKLIKNFEIDKNKCENKIDTLTEMVENLSESKINYVTKIESLQRQLNVQVNENESLKSSEKLLLDENKVHRHEIEKLQRTLEKNHDLVKQLKENLNGENNDKKLALMDKIKSLEEQLSQTIRLKQKLKEELEENAKLKKTNDQHKNKIEELKTIQIEKKALDILLGESKSSQESLHRSVNELKSRNSLLETQLKDTKLELEELTLKQESVNSQQMFLKEAEVTALNEVKNENIRLQQVLADLKKFETENITLKEQLCDSNKNLEKSYDDLINLKNLAENLQNTESDRLKLAESEITDLKAIVSNLEEEKEKLVSQMQHLSEEKSLLEISLTKDFNVESRYLDLKEEALKLISLIQLLFFSKNDESTIENDDATKLIKKCYENVETKITYLKESELDNLFNKSCSDITSFSKDLDFLLNMNHSIDNELLVAKPVYEMFDNLRELCFIISKFFEFQLVPDVISKLEEIQSSSFVFGNLLKEVFNHRLSCDAERASLIQEKEDCLRQIAVLNEHKSEESLSLEKSLTDVKQELELLNNLKLIQEKNIEDLTKSQRELEEVTRSKDEQISTLKENLEKVHSDDSLSINELDETKKLMQDQSNVILKLESELESSKTSCANLSLDLEQHSKEMSLLNDKLNEENSNKELLVKNFKEEISNLNSEISSNKELCDNKNSDLETLKMQLEELFTKHKASSLDFEEKSKEMTSKVDKITLDLNQSEKNNLELKDLINDQNVRELDLNSRLKLLEEEKKALEDKIFSSESLIPSQIEKLQIENEKALAEAHLQIEKLKSQLEESLVSLESLKSSNDSLINESETKELQYKTSLSSLEEKLTSVAIENESLNKKLREIGEAFDEAKQKAVSLTVDLNQVQSDLVVKENLIEELDKSLQIKTDLLNELNDSTSQKESSLTIDLSKTIEEKQTLKESLEDIATFKNNQLEETLTSKCEENAILKDKLCSLESKLEELVKINAMEVKNEEFPLTDSSNKAEGKDEDSHTHELIEELNKMNQVLRERGEKISLLEDLVREKNREMDSLRTQLSDANSKMSSREEELVCKQELLQKLQLSPSEDSVPSSTLEDKIKTLTAENNELKKNLQTLSDNEAHNKSMGGDTQSEVMSTSTISRAEDVHRVRELEDSFEERFIKLKSVAIKLKKKLAEQTAAMKTLEDNKKKEIEEILKKSNGTNSRNIQALQGEIDRLQDQVDSQGKELKDKEKLLHTSAEELSELKTNLLNSEEEKEKNTKQINNLEELLAGERQTCQNLRVIVSDLEKGLNFEKEQLTKLASNQKVAEEKLISEMENKNLITKQLEEVKQESKKQSLIDLELKDYERTIEELNAVISAKDAQIFQLQHDFQNESVKCANFSDQKSFFQGQVESETERAEKLKKSTSDLKFQVEELQQNYDKLTIEKESCCGTIEALNQDLERMKLSMSELSAESTATQSLLRKKNETAEMQIEKLEKRIKDYENENSILKQELEVVKNDFQVYKVRAQSVLRQKAKTPEESYEQTKAERDQLIVELETVTVKIHQLQSEFSTVKAEAGYLSSEKDRFSMQLSKSTQEYQRKETELLQKVSFIEKKLEDKTSEYQLIIANMSSQSESMAKSFKAQLDNQKETHTQEIVALKTKIDELEDKLWHLKNQPTSGVAKTENKEIPSVFLAPHHMRKQSQGVVTTSPDDLNRVDVSNMIREQGEGSEWVEPMRGRSPSHSRYSPPTLENLISHPFPSQQSLDDTLSIHSYSDSKEVVKLEAKVGLLEQRISQLTSLLGDSEDENAKLSELSDALKEEIRRASRNENREKHLENNEYIKNVFIKFLSLKTGDEKSRLVPVLKTMLQLSPEETKHVFTIASGEENHSSSSPGWGNYMHLWSGTK